MTVEVVVDVLPAAASVMATRFPPRWSSRIGDLPSRRRRERAVTDVLVASGIPASPEARSWLRQMIKAAATAGPAKDVAALRQVHPSRPLAADPRALEAARTAVVELGRRSLQG